MSKLKYILVGVVLAGVTGCVDSIGVNADSVVPGVEDSDPLAISFDSLAQGSRLVGDVARADGFTYAALAVRGGLTPAPLDLRIDNTVQRFEALVTSNSWDQSIPDALRPPSHRALVAWQRGADNILRILSLASPADSAAVTPPLNFLPNGPLSDVYRGATALYYEINLSDPGSSRERYELATAGYAIIQEVARGGGCSVRLNAKVATNGVSCLTARFIVQLSISMRRLESRPALLAAAATERSAVTVREQSLNGYAIKFNCSAVSAQLGCFGR